MTPTQQKLYEFVRSQILLTGEGPTYRMMREYMGFSSNQAVTDMVAALEAEGFVEIMPGKKGGISLGKSTLSILRKEEMPNTTSQITPQEPSREAESGTASFFVLLNPGFSNVSAEVPNIKSATTKGVEKWNGTP